MVATARDESEPRCRFAGGGLAAALGLRRPPPVCALGLARALAALAHEGLPGAEGLGRLSEADRLLWARRLAAHYAEPC